MARSLPRHTQESLVARVKLNVSTPSLKMSSPMLMLKEKDLSVKGVTEVASCPIIRSSENKSSLFAAMKRKHKKGLTF